MQTILQLTLYSAKNNGRSNIIFSSFKIRKLTKLHVCAFCTVHTQKYDINLIFGI